MNFNKWFSSSSSRSAKAYKNIISSFLIKGISIIINLALIPLTIAYLSPAKYGIWITISSMVSWISFFDVGLGHGLRNKLAESFAKNDIVKAKSYVSTAYISIAILCIGLFIIFVSFNHLINWKTLLNINSTIDENVGSIVLILMSIFLIQFTLQLINSILLSVQQPAKVSLFNMIANLFVLVTISIIMKFSKESLLNIALVLSITPVIILAIVNIFYFKTEFKNFSPSIKAFDIKVLKDVLNIGLKFFMIQISVLILFQTSNFLICRYFSPDMVTPYNIAFRYFGIITMVFSIITAPYWSAYTDAYVKQDFEWINSSLKKLFIMWLILVIIAIIMLLFSEIAYDKWLGGKVKVDFKISLWMMIYTLVVSFSNIFIMLLNGIGKIKIQMWVNIIGMILFIPLAKFLAVYLHLGIIGIIISTIICSLYGVLIAPFEVKQILSKNRKVKNV